MELADSTRALLALHLVPGIGHKLTAALLERFQTPEKVLQARIEELVEIPHLPRNVAERILRVLASGDVAAELASMQEHGVHVIARGEAAYPAELTSITDAPSLLYIAGSLLPADARAVGIVGSRQCTSYGRRVAERMAGDLARAGFTIISGLARGIDEAVHRGALKAGGRTLAVLAGGLHKIYPPEHAELAKEVKGQGALISESAMRMEPMAGMFPARNRIISGMSKAVIVVEAADKSGALITARHAAEQGREVFAVPGQVDSLASSGTLRLIRDGARLVRHAGDVLEDLAELMPQATTPEALFQEAPPGLSDVDRQVWEFLAEKRYVDDIARRLNKSAGELSVLLMQLELKKVIRRLPGNMYERC